MAKAKRKPAAVRAAPVHALEPVFEPVHVFEPDPMLNPVVKPEPIIEPELKPILDPVPEPEPVLGPVPEPEPVPEPAEPIHIGPVHEDGEAKKKISDFLLFERIPEYRFVDENGKVFRMELHSSGVYWLYPV